MGGAPDRLVHGGSQTGSHRPAVSPKLLTRPSKLPEDDTCLPFRATCSLASLNISVRDQPARTAGICFVRVAKYQDCVCARSRLQSWGAGCLPSTPTLRPLARRRERGKNRN